MASLTLSLTLAGGISKFATLEMIPQRAQKRLQQRVGMPVEKGLQGQRRGGSSLPEFSTERGRSFPLPLCLLLPLAKNPALEVTRTQADIPWDCTNQALEGK